MRFACRRINSLRVLENLIAFYVGRIPASAMTARGQTDCLVMEPRIYDRTQGLFEEHFTAANRTLDGKLDSGITHCDFLLKSFGRLSGSTKPLGRICHIAGDQICDQFHNIAAPRSIHDVPIGTMYGT
jgi:hypothetical protein